MAARCAGVKPGETLGIDLQLERGARILEAGPVEIARAALEAEWRIVDRAHELRRIELVGPERVENGTARQEHLRDAKPATAPAPRGPRCGIEGP